MKLFCYHISPIDYWPGAMTREDLLKTMTDNQYSAWSDLADACRNLDTLQSKAEEAFKKITWEGDVCSGPFYFALPGDTHMAIGFILKQDNNGATFIASPYELPHLDTLCMTPKIVVD